MVPRTTPRRTSAPARPKHYVRTVFGGFLCVFGRFSVTGVQKDTRKKISTFPKNHPGGGIFFRGGVFVPGGFLTFFSFDFLLRWLSASIAMVKHLSVRGSQKRTHKIMGSKRNPFLSIVLGRFWAFLDTGN
jgi:hypothetical protein